MATPITLDEFFEMAQLGGQIKAYHDIIELMNECHGDGDEFIAKIMSNFKLLNKDFTNVALKFKMGGSKVRMDEESIDGLGKEDDTGFKLV